MVDRPILFSAPMVRALLAGTKTQTRRTIKLKTGDTFDEKACVGAIQEWRPVFDKVAGKHVGRESVVIRCPYGVPGDFLWVKETYRLEQGAGKPSQSEGFLIHYEADGAPNPEHEWGAKARSSIYMPRWASRITLKITDVRVERLRDCSEADALAEGIYRVDPDADDLANGCTPEDFVFMAPGTRQGWGMTKEERAKEQWSPTATGAYALLGEAINGAGSWVANPWVWVVSFERS